MICIPLEKHHMSYVKRYKKNARNLLQLPFQKIQYLNIKKHFKLLVDLLVFLYINGCYKYLKMTIIYNNYINKKLSPTNHEIASYSVPCHFTLKKKSPKLSHPQSGRFSFTTFLPFKHKKNYSQIENNRTHKFFYVRMVFIPGI